MGMSKEPAQCMRVGKNPHQFQLVCFYSCHMTTNPLRIRMRKWLKSDLSPESISSVSQGQIWVTSAWPEWPTRQQQQCRTALTTLFIITINKYAHSQSGFIWFPSVVCSLSQRTEWSMRAQHSRSEERSARGCKMTRTSSAYKLEMNRKLVNNQQQAEHNIKC